MSGDLVEIKNVPLGTEVEVSTDAGYIDPYGRSKRCVVVIGSFKSRLNEMCLGWFETSGLAPDAGSTMTAPYITALMTNRIYTMVSNFPTYQRYKWINGNIRVRILSDDALIISKDQKCIGCELPAPHAKPNVVNGFLCVACKVLDDIGMEQLRLDELVERG